MIEMKSTQHCDYTRPGAEPWWECCPAEHADDHGLGDRAAA
jgi:hypothetical protein